MMAKPPLPQILIRINPDEFELLKAIAKEKESSVTALGRDFFKVGMQLHKE